jgi:hypothetical protein
MSIVATPTRDWKIKNESFTSRATCTPSVKGVCRKGNNNFELAKRKTRHILVPVVDNTLKQGYPLLPFTTDGLSRGHGRRFGIIVNHVLVPVVPHKPVIVSSMRNIAVRRRSNSDEGETSTSNTTFPGDWRVKRSNVE